MIEYINLSNQEYYNALLKKINTISDQRELEDMLKSLSYKLYYKEIEPEQARRLITVIKSRIAILSSGGRRASGGPSNSQDKVISFSPTSVSNRAGTVSVVFLVVNVALTTIMYTLLILSKFIG